MSSQEKTPQKSSVEKTPQEKTPQKSPVEKTPYPILGLVEKTPHPIFRLVEKTPQLYKKPSFWNFDMFYLNVFKPSPLHFIKSPHIGILTFLFNFQPLSLFLMLVEETPFYLTL